MKWASADTASATLRVHARSAKRFDAWLRNLVILALVTFLLLGGFSVVLAADAPSTPKPAAKSEESRVRTSLLAGWLATVEQSGEGGFTNGNDIYLVRYITTVNLTKGLYAGMRIDATAIGQLNLANPDLSMVRTVEVYGALAYLFDASKFWVGPACGGGGLIPVEAAVWNYQGLVACGGRVGYGRSWAYAFVGYDQAADFAVGGGKRLRFISPGALEFKKFVATWDLVSGAGGRKRFGLLYDIRF